MEKTQQAALRQRQRRPPRERQTRQGTRRPTFGVPDVFAQWAPRSARLSVHPGMPLAAFFLTLDGRGSLVKHLGPDSWRSRRAASAPKRVDATCRVGGPLEHCSVCLPAGHLHTKRKHCVSDLKCTNCRVEANVMQRFSVQQHTNESVLDEMIMHQAGDRSFDCLTMVFCCSVSSSASIGSFGLRQRSCSDLRSTQRRRYHLLPEATTKKHCGQLWVSPLLLFCGLATFLGSLSLAPSVSGQRKK